jgi:hypothetical protein
MLRHIFEMSFRSAVVRAGNRLIPPFALPCFMALGIALAPTAGAFPPPRDYPVGGLIAAKYKALGGSAGPLGRPTSKEMDSKEGKGRYQTFEHGVIGVTPSTGPKSVQALYAKDFELVFEWGDTSPFNYDYFIVSCERNGQLVVQPDVKGGPRTSGKWVTRPSAPGRYRLVVEGRDTHIGGGKSRQGWSNALYLDFVPPPPIPTKYKQLGGSTGPLGRATSKEMDSKEGKGRYQTFEHGVIGWSPATGPNSVQALYVKNKYEMVFEWGDTSPFNYDYFIVRCDLDDKNPSFPHGRKIVEPDIKGGPRTGGKWVTRPHSAGRYRVAVEGRDTHLSGGKSRQGWSNALYLDFVPPPPEYTGKTPIKLPLSTFANVPLDDFARILTLVPPANSISDAKATFDKRAAAAVLYHACLPLPPKMFEAEQDSTARVLAYLAYPDYFQTDGLVPVKGRTKATRKDANDWLLRQTIESRAGTSGDWPSKRTGEYDVALTGLIAIVYKHYPLLTPAVQNHIINNLLNIRGPLDPLDAWPYRKDLRDDDAIRNILASTNPVNLAVPETENHLMMIESARYLTNQLLYRREGDPKYDNERNGMDEWMLKHLQTFLKKDFIEYNAKDYQDYTMTALLNLYTFTRESNKSSKRVKMAAQMVLDYLMAKVAVSSNDSRRYVTYRRKVSYNDPNFLARHYDPQIPFSMAFAGTTDMLVGQSKRELLGNYAWEAWWAGLSDYRVPDSILDLMVNRPHRTFFQRFHTAYADEAYAGSPSYLISSGGHYATFAYTIAGKGSHDDIGLPLATTLMPTGQFTTATDFIQFAGAGANEDRSNMGVAKDFACGLFPIIPQAYKAAAVSVDDKGQRSPGNLKAGPWTFINQSLPGGAHLAGRRVGVYPSSAGSFHPGYYVAVYRNDVGQFGFMEAYDTALRPGLSFEAFITGVLKNNAKTSFRKTGRNTYVMTGGRKIEFSLAPNSVVHLPAEKPFFVKGDILNGAEGSGHITIDNPLMRRHVVLDFRDWKAPKRTSN